MKNFLQRLIHLMKRASSQSKSQNQTSEQTGRSFKNNLKQTFVGQLKKIKDSAQVKGKINALSNKSLPFNWDELIAKLFAPRLRPIIHRIFLVAFTLSFAYAMAKIVIFFAQPKVADLSMERPMIPVMMTPPLARESFQTMKEANLFNIKQDDQDSGTGQQKNKADLICERSNKPSSLPIKLLQTTVMQDGRKSLASVEVRGMRDIAMLRIGESIESYAKLDRIERQRLIVKNYRTGDCEYIESDDMTESARLTQPFDVLSPGEGNKLIAGTRPSAIRQDGNAFKIKKSYRDTMLEDIGQILTQAKAVQIRNPDGSLSFQMTEVVPGSIYAHLNIQNGDIIKSINGEPIQDLNKLMTLFGNIKNLDNVQIGVVKDGQEQNMDFSFE